MHKNTQILYKFFKNEVKRLNILIFVVKDCDIDFIT